jgi:hypothetical protein
MNQNYVKKASLMFLFSFFNDMSWPATQGNVEVIVFREEEIYLQNNSIQQLDMAAIYTLKAEIATGVRSDIQNFRTLFNHIILDDSKLTVLLNGYLQLYNRWATLQYAIQTLK